MQAQPITASPNTEGIGKHPMNFWDQLTAPLPFVPQNDHRKARLLSNTLVFFVVLSTFVTLILPISLSKINNTPLNLPIDFLIEEFIYIGLYFLSRTKYYQLSALLITVVVNLVIWNIINTIPGANGLDLLTLVAVLAGLLLSIRTTAIIFAFNFVGLLVGPVLQQKFGFSPTANFPNAISLYIVFFGLFLVFMRYRDLLEKDRVQEALKADEQRRLADQLRESDQVKSRFLASMSHELRTPLNSIINFTEFVIDGDTGPINDQQKDLLVEVVTSGKHLLNLINDVLDMSKIEAGSLKLFVEDNINLKTIIERSMASCRSLLKESVQMKSALDDNLPLIRGDQHRILQIMLNILSNACKFTEKGEIKVSAHQAQSEIIIAVQVSGPGIPPEDQTLVFEAFKQTTTGLRQGGGTGLGMPIARSLAETHGGRLWLESELGKGTTFYVALPIKSEKLVPVL